MSPDQLSLGQLLTRAAERAPDRPALIHDSGTLTWAQVDEAAWRAATLLADLGLGPGQTLGLCTSKRPELVVAFLAAARLGALVAPINFKQRPHQVARQLEVGQVRALLLEASLDEVPEPGRAAIGERVLYVGPAGSWSGHTWDQVLTAPRASLPEVDPHTPVYLNFTSGTSGEPKAAVQTHAHIGWNALSGVEGLGFSEDDVFMGMFSVFSHPHEVFHRSLWVAGTAVLSDTLSPRIAASIIEEHGVTWMMAVPSFYELMAAHLRRGRHDLSSLRVLEAGGAWTPPDARVRIEAALGARFQPVWGSTEAAGAALSAPADHSIDATGRAITHYQARVTTPEGTEAAPGQTGELWLRGPAVCSSYLGNDQATAQTFVDGWYRTGDLFHHDGAGWLHFEGRRSEMMKVGGIRVFPLEIERVLLAHPLVEEVVVVRARERLRGEVPRAVLRLTPDARLSPDELKRWCRDHLADYKVPRIVEIRGEIPKLPNGKIDRKAVAEEQA